MVLRAILLWSAIGIALSLGTTWALAVVAPPEWLATVRCVMIKGELELVSTQRPEFEREANRVKMNSPLGQQVFEERFGWPLHSMSVQYVRNSTAPMYSVRMGRGVDLGGIRRIQNPDHASASVPLALPLVPTVWFLPNAAIWAILAFGTVWTARTVRGAIRKWKQTCPQCAYPHTGPGPCPECGHGAVVPPTPAQ